MNRFYRSAFPLMIAAALTIVLAAPGLAFVNPVIDFGTGYAIEDARAVDDHMSAVDDTLLIVGLVVGFNEPFDDLDPNDPTVEYTYVYRALISEGTVVSGSGSSTVYTTDYADGGVLEIYADPSMDSDFADPSTFMNGDLILAASLSDYRLTTLAINCSGSQSALFQFTAGSLFSRVSSGGVGWGGIAPGLFSVCSILVPAAQQAQGYFGLSDTKLDIDPGTPTEKRTWGQIKQGLR